MEFHINSSIAPKIFSIGNENTKVIVIDDFSADLDCIRKSACEDADFLFDVKSAYPGIRAPLPDEYIAQVLSVISPLLRENYAIPDALELRAELANYSLLTKREEDLNVLQRIPHFDTNSLHYYAVLHYLNDGSYGGTGFFRHRPTGFERITEERRDIFMQSASAFMAVRGMPQPKYINRSTNHFELFAQLEYKPNRLVIYPGSLLHSGLVSPDSDICDNPEKGRLTANIFINCS